MSVKGGDVIFNFKANDKDLQSSVNEMGSSIKKMVTALGLDKLISKTVGALNNSLDGAIKRVDTLNNFPRVMNNLGIATEDATEAVNELSDGLVGLPTTLNDGVSAVQRFTSQNNDVKKSTKMFLALNNAILAGGASTEVQASAMEQLSQAYAKGKPDAMEWRSMLTAMPAQLKQVAKYMGYTSTAVGGDLYTAIQQGKVSMDDFMGVIMTLNSKGVGEFASFAEQAKSSTGGIATSITNVKTAITRGLANSIEALNKSLKKANLPTVSEIIQKAGTTISKAFGKVNEAIGKIKWNKITPIIKDVFQYMNSLKSTLIDIGKTVLKSILPVISNPAIIKLIVTFKTINPLIKTGTSLIGGLSKAIGGLSSPVGMATLVVGGLATAITYLINNQTEEQKKAKELSETIKSEKQELDEFNRTIDDNLSRELGQINRTQNLNNELKTLVDENGKVKEGYEDRVKFILNELNNALGTEMTLVDGVVQGYKDQGKEIDKLIEKKRAQAILDAGYEKYKNAIDDQKKATEELNGVLGQMGMDYDTASETVKKFMDAYNNNDLEKGFNILKEAGIKSGDLVIAFDNADKRIKENTSNINGYIENQTHFLKGEYDQIKTTVTTTYDNIDDYTVNELENSIRKQKDYINNLEQIYANGGDEITKQEIDEANERLKLLEQQLNARSSEAYKGAKKEYEVWKNNGGNIFDFLKQQVPKIIEQGKKTGEGYANGIKSKEEIITQATRTATGRIEGVINSLDSTTWGSHLGQGLANGLESSQARIQQTASRIAGVVSNFLHFTRPDKGALRNYEKWMPDFVQGLTKTLEASTPSLYGAINKMAGKMKEQLSLGFGMSPTLNNVSSYNPSINVTVQNNMKTDFMGNLVSNVKTFSNGSKNDYNYGM